MKKIILFAFLVCVFVSCSSDGSREIQIDEVSFTSGNEFIETNEIEKVSSIFEVVPGKYELAWRLVQEVPQMQNFNVSLKLKLRLKKTVKFTDQFIENIKKENLGFNDLDFYIVDANGKENQATLHPFFFGYKGCVNGTDTFDKDEYMDFINFLQSKPGTEKEFELNSFGMKTSVDGVNCIETCKNAKSVICKVGIRDKDFERRIGIIE